MVSPEQYKAGYPERIKEKIFLPYDKDGDLNSDAIAAASFVESKLSEYQNFIGLTYHGSKALGYSHESSDIDFWLLYDNVSADPETYEAFYNEVHKLDDQMFGTSRLNFHFANVAPERLVRTLDNPSIAKSVGALCGAARGPRVRECREKLAVLIKEKYTDVQRRGFVSVVAEAQAELESQRSNDIHWRVTGASLDKETFYDQRYSLWKQRICDVLHVEI